MAEYLDPQFWLDLLRGADVWVRTHVLVVSNLIQILAIIGTFLLARFLRGPVIRLVLRFCELPRVAKHGAAVQRVAVPLVLPMGWLVLIWLVNLGSAVAGWPHQLTASAVTLLTAWVAIRFLANFIADPFWARVVATAAWTLAALNLLGILDPALTFLDAMALQLGDLRISLLGLVKAGVVLAVLLWGANALSGLLEKRIGVLPGVTPSAQVLFGKLSRVALYVVAFLIALNSVGIDLTALAVFTGAIGLGLGFGLQKVVSNLISGVILLMDKSVKPGDVVAIGTTYGWVKSMGARYVSVITRDSIEHLIPNEELIGRTVENWSYSSRDVRQKLPFGVAYTSDVHKAIKLAIQAASEFDRILKDPAPSCLLKGFGDNSVDLELRVWIRDAEKGLSNFKSEVYLRLWDLFKEHGIEFPFPQRDLHIRDAVPVRLEQPD